MGSTKKGTQNPAKNHKLSESARMTIIVAIIGLIGTLGAAYLNYLSARPQIELTIPAPVSSVTQVTSVTETLTVAPTASVTPTTSSTPVSPENFGGLTADCIPDQYWDAFDTIGSRIIPNANGCLQVSSRGLHADDRKLLIILNHQDVRESFSQTLFLPISGDVEISFTVLLEDLKNGSDSETDPLFSVGICNPDPNKVRIAHNFIAYSYPVPQQWFWGILNNDLTNFKKKDTFAPNTHQSFLIKIDSFDLSIEDTTTGNYIWTNAKVSPSDLKAFCIRYQLPTLGTLKVSIEDISILKK